MTKRATILTVVGSLLCAAPVAMAQIDTEPTEIRLTSGFEFSTGRYGGSENIDETYVPISMGVSRGRWSARLTVPYLSVQGPAGTELSDGDGEPIPGTGEITRESGIGDIVGSLTLYDLVRSDEHAVAVDLSAKVKMGTADSNKGLGTGENDYSVLLDVYKFMDRLALAGTVGYKFRGEPPGVELEDVFLGSVGTLCECNRRTRLGVFYDYRQSSLEAGEDLQEITLYASRDLNHIWRFQYYVFKGLTDAGPDWGGGLQFGVVLSGRLRRPET